MIPRSTHLLLGLDLAGTLLFAIQGAMFAIAANLDLLGILVLSFATALGGGVIRDLLIGAVPPLAIQDWRYTAIAFAGGFVTFFLYSSVQQIPPMLLTTLDAAGLALFCVAGTTKALSFGIHPFSAVLMGTITGVGGGVIRDVLLSAVPNILRTDIYATAALAGSVVLVAARKYRLSPGKAAILGGAACFVLRIVAVSQNWALPTALSH